MLEMVDVSYAEISNNKKNELFTLRKATFKDRLDWAVTCSGNMEFDQYDNQHTNYLLGIHNGELICSVRFIEMQYPNMLEGTFFSFFQELKIPAGNYIESSRFFVDRTRSRNLNPLKNKVTLMLFLSMVNYSRHYNYDGILTIVSHAMLTILKRSGWGITVIEQGLSEKRQPIYLLLLPNDDHNQKILIDRITQDDAPEFDCLMTWPLSFSLITEAD